MYELLIKVPGEAGIDPKVIGVTTDESNCTDASLAYLQALYLTTTPDAAIVCPVEFKTVNLKSGPNALIFVPFYLLFYKLMLI
jgi:hypothetical protein